MMAHPPPMRCASAMTCCTIVVLPDASGPKISVTRPRGMPPTPRAISSAMEPVGMISTAMRCWASPSFMIEPLPNCFSICEMAFSIAFDLSASAMALLYLPCQDWSAPICVRAAIVARMFWSVFVHLVQQLQGQAQGSRRAGLAIRRPIAVPAVLADQGALGVHRGHVGQPDRFVDRSSTGASNARGRQTQVSAGNAADAVGHRFNRLGTHRPVFFDECRHNAENLALEAGVVRHYTAADDPAPPAPPREPLDHHAPPAAF